MWGSSGSRVGAVGEAQSKGKPQYREGAERRPMPWEAKRGICVDRRQARLGPAPMLWRWGCRAHLLRRQKVEAAGRVRLVRHALAIVAMLRPNHQRAKRAGRLPHEAGVVHIELDVVLVPKVEEDRRPGLPVPPLVKDKKALLERLVRLVAQRRRPLEVVDLLLEPVRRTVVRAGAALSGAALATRKGLPPGHDRRGCRRPGGR
jgi:hypothetical protein